MSQKSNDPKDYTAEQLLEMAIAHLGEWVMAVSRDSSWDGWDEHYKDAHYDSESRKSPINTLVREYIVANQSEDEDFLFTKDSGVC